MSSGSFRALALCAALFSAGCTQAPPGNPIPAASGSSSAHPPATAQAIPGKAEQLGAVMSAYHAVGKFDGAVLVAEKGAVIYRGAFGLANREWNIPNTVDTRYRIASITKTFTAALVMQLVQEGKIKLDAKITEYLPDYRKDTGNKVTVHHLLSHQSGIPDYINIDSGKFFFERIGNRHDRGKLVKELMSRDLLFEPGSRASYNNTGYFLLGIIIENVTGKKYDEVLEEKILRPLGMSHSGYSTPGKIIEKMASGYTRTFTGDKAASHIDMGNIFSGGGIYTTVDDLFLWDQALYTTRILTEESKQRVFKGYMQDPVEKQIAGEYGWPAVGYAWFVGKRKYGEVGEVSVAEHGGNLFGFRSLVTRLVDDRHLIVLLANEGGGARNITPHEITAQIVSVLYGKPATMPKRALASAIIDAVLAHGIDAAMRQLEALRTSSAPLKSDAELNSLGCDYMYAGMLKEAIAILKLNVELYPNVGNCFDSLGEAYMLKGDKELAIENYEQALKVDPKNANAVQKLKELRAK